MRSRRRSARSKVKPGSEFKVEIEEEGGVEGEPEEGRYRGREIKTVNTTVKLDGHRNRVMVGAPPEDREESPSEASFSGSTHRGSKRNAAAEM